MKKFVRFRLGIVKLQHAPAHTTRNLKDVFRLGHSEVATLAIQPRTAVLERRRLAVDCQYREQCGRSTAAVATTMLSPVFTGAGVR